MWASDLTSTEADVPKELKDEIKKMALASAFAADAALDSFQMTIRRLAFSVSARWNTWFQSWEVDLSAQARVVAVPFNCLFGNAINRYVIEDKDKKKDHPLKKRMGKCTKVFTPSEILEPPLKHHTSSHKDQHGHQSPKRKLKALDLSEMHKNPKKSVWDTREGGNRQQASELCMHLAKINPGCMGFGNCLTGLFPRIYSEPKTQIPAPSSDTPQRKNTR